MIKIDKAFLKRYFVIEAAVFAFLLILDLVSKALISNFFADPNSPSVVTVIPHLIGFTYVENTGAAFGMGEGLRWLFVVITIIATAGFVFAMWKFRDQPYMFRITLAVIIAGTLGNFIDRLFLGYVRDFIKFLFWDKFAIFNVADMALVVGVIVMAVFIVFFFKDPKAVKKTTPTIEAASCQSTNDALQSGSTIEAGEGDQSTEQPDGSGVDNDSK